jgi:glycerol-3-phosphate acyltransferase PlsY
VSSTVPARPTPYCRRFPLTKHQILFILVSYLVGSIPFGSIIYFIIKKKDIRQEGSGNIGATNVLRTTGKMAGFTTLLLDMAKGILPVVYGFTHLDMPHWVLLGGAAAIVGHIFPIFLRFKGGKGAATFVGVFVAFDYPAVLIFILVFLAILWFYRYVSLGVILASIALFFYILFNHTVEAAIVTFLLVILIIARHTSNIKRLLAGKENKFSLTKNG